MRPATDRKKSPMLAAMRWLDDRHPATVCAWAALLIGGIGWLSYGTGPYISTSLFYLIPILLVAQVAGFRGGAAAAVLAVISWLAVDLNGGGEFGHPFVPYWNAVMRLGTYLVAIGFFSAMCSLNAQLERRVQERTVDLEKQIHENRELEKSIIEISDRERAAVGQDLHDGLCQQLVCAAFSCRMLEDKLAKVPNLDADEVGRISTMIDDSISQARDLARGLFPVRLEKEGLELALRELASNISRRFGVDCGVECPDDLPGSGRGSSVHLYRIAQEAAINAVKHSGSGGISIRLSRTPRGILLTIQDRGKGIGSGASKGEGMGLRIMEYRARLMGADFRIESSDREGTRVECELDDQSYRR
jgi:signal transduction histidine kinase